MQFTRYRLNDRNNMNMKNETQSLAVTESETQALAEFSSDLGFAPKTMEEFELIKSLLESAAALDGLELPKLKSIDLAQNGVVFDIIDAVQSTINVEVKTENGAVMMPKAVVSFIIELDGEIYAVMKDGNSINLQYAEFFSKFKAIGKPQRKNGFQFVEATWLPKKSGNHPVILQRVRTEKQIGKGK